MDDEDVIRNMHILMAAWREWKALRSTIIPRPRNEILQKRLCFQFDEIAKTFYHLYQFEITNDTISWYLSSNEVDEYYEIVDYLITHYDERFLAEVSRGMFSDDDDDEDEDEK